MLKRLLAALRARPLLYGLGVLIAIMAWQIIWILSSQPTYGRWLAPWEIAYLIAGLVVFFVLIFVGWDRPTAQAFGAKLSKSRWTGVFVTLTTVLLILSIGEWGLRLFYITTDGYGFTAMNYWWYQNFGLAQDNSLGYRDAEPQPDRPGLTRVAVLGDSFAMGHGINDRDATFAQLLERDLGADVDVNLIADSGRDLDLHLPFLEQYPLQPDVVVYSYYLNDIDYLLTDDRAPDQAFTFIEEEPWRSLILNFFLPNYIYYNVMQFTSQQRGQEFVGSLFSAYDDESLWAEQAFRLNQLIDWTQAHDVRLIVLLWPHIAAIDQSQPALDRVRGVLNERGVPTVDMTGILRQYPLNDLIVNRFDTHPSVLSHQLAAQALLPVVRAAIEG